jgi:hypothetical protein
MLTGDVIDVIRSTPRDTFIAQQKDRHYLMLTTRVSEDEESGFDTLVEEPQPAFKGKSRSTMSRQLSVLAVEKAAGNPWPDRISVGRARNCDVALRDPSVSKLHAHFKVREGGYDLVDLDSQNGTRVNGTLLTPNEPKPVSSGDVLLFGMVSCKLVSAALLYDLLR